MHIPSSVLVQHGQSVGDVLSVSLGREMAADSLQIRSQLIRVSLLGASAAQTL